MNATDDRIYTNEHCTGCNRCIAACTVPDANIALMENGRNKIHTDARHCINCGKCIEACPHQARDYVDDTDAFLAALSQGERVSALFAPAVRSNFPQFEKLLGLLRGLGCEYLYDTSFGADITTWAYIRTLQKSGAKGLISQPCPAVVNYIEKHDPALIASLVPVHSPALCAAVYMRQYAGVTGKIAFISPCIAKKDEFNDPNTHEAVQYNVTFRKLQQALVKMGRDYLLSPADSFDNARHGLGAIYPMPGGLKENVHSVIPDAWVFQVEGQPEVRHFLEDYGKASSQDKPFLVDILNCGKGCNLGTGALAAGKDGLRVDHCMHTAKHNAGAPSGRRGGEPASFRQFDQKLKLADFSRSYTNQYTAPAQYSPRDLEQAFLGLQKHSEAQRHIDCCSCGFATCQQMAAAVSKGINHVENCVDYHRNILQVQKAEMQELAQHQQQMADALRVSVESMFADLSETTAKSEETTALVSNINHEVEGMTEISLRLGAMMDTLKKRLQSYVDLGGRIVDIATMTKLLSMNASVEAAHAQQHGKGFAVVAEEMKSLSEQSGRSAREILSSNEDIFPLLDEVRSIGDSLNSRAGIIAGSTQDILGAITDITEAEQRITQTASQLVHSAGMQV